MELTLAQIILLAIVQGITEFLPVSSSGHLVVLQSLFAQLGEEKLPDIVEVNILLHAGTLAAIVVFYWRRILRLLTEDRRVIGLLVVGTLPAVMVGVPLKMYASHLLANPLLTGFMFLLTAGLLLWTSRRREGDLGYQQLSYRQAFVIGLFQAAAILPGLSRSGWTIAGGTLLKVRREASATFSFLLAIPAIAGATVLELKDLSDGHSASAATGVLAVGTVVAFVVGFASLWGLIKIVQHGRLVWFAWYLIPLGVAVIYWQLGA